MVARGRFRLARLVVVFLVGFAVAWWRNVLPEDRPERWEDWTEAYRERKLAGEPVYSYSRELEEGGFSADAAYRHLLRLGMETHSYATDEIDSVERYLLSYAEAIREYAKTRGVKVEVDYDRHTSILAYEKTDKLSKRSRQIPVYFEASNIIIRVAGRNDDALLVSAHHDSQGSSHGATDDGVAVAIALELLRTASHETPENSLVVLLDSAEEKGLLGSRSFIHHPWFKAVRAVINLEASGAGGRALLFQANSDTVLEAFARAPHPFGSSIGNDAFNQGLINSRTDFEVYRAANLTGIDMAICSNRAIYHTRRDDVEHVYFSSLTLFGETVLSAAHHLLQKASLEGSPLIGGVFFGILGHKMIVLTQPQMVWIVICTIVVLLNLLARRAFPIRGLLAIGFGISLYAGLLAVSTWLWADLHLHSHAITVYLSSALLGLSCLSTSLVVWANYEGVATPSLEKPLLSSLLLMWLFLQIANLILLHYNFSSLYPTLILSLAHVVVSLISRSQAAIGLRATTQLMTCLVTSILMHDSGMMLILSLSQGIPTGSSNFGTHCLISFMSIFPVLSFVPTLPAVLYHRPLRAVTLSFSAWALCITVLYNRFPLNASAPMAVHFEQHVCTTPQISCLQMTCDEAPPIYQNSSFIRAIAPSYLDLALAKIPSAVSHPLSPVVPYYHMTQKLYAADLPYLPPSSVSFKLTSEMNSTFTFQLEGHNSRICGLRFQNLRLEQLTCRTMDSAEVSLLPNNSAQQDQFMLLRRSAQQPFVLKATPTAPFPPLLRVSAWCGYDEIDKYIPAMQEASQTLPPWAILSTTQPALLTVHADFVINLNVTDA